MMRRYFWFGCLGLGVGLVGACSSGEVAPHKPASPAVTQLLQSVCDASLRCCSRGEVDYFMAPFVDGDNCAERLLEQARRRAQSGFGLSALEQLSGTAVWVPNLGALDQAVQDGRTRIDPVALEACLDHLTSLGCNEFSEEEEVKRCEGPQEPPSSLEPVPCDPEQLFVGRLSMGSVCTSAGGVSLECAPGLVCMAGVGLGVEGRCVEAQIEGGVCGGDSECAKGLYCSALDGTCQRPRAEGEVCVFSDRNDPAPEPEKLLVRCQSHLSCDPITNTCVALCQAGARCESDEDCDAGSDLSCIVGRCAHPRGEGLPCEVDEHCEEDYFCGPDRHDASQSVCTAKEPVSSECEGHRECQSGYCAPDTGRCAAPVAIGALCPSGLDEQCDGGRCAPEVPSGDLGYCFEHEQCPITGFCDTGLETCATYCVATKPDGSTCTVDSECASEACIAGYCRTVPLALGVACDSAVDCASEFCNYADERVCADLPLPLNERCATHAECDSGVCFSSTSEPPRCINGLGEGEACGEAGVAPCNPHSFYCDTEDHDPPVCVPLKETGEFCKLSLQCRGDCVVRNGREMCSAAAPKGNVVCDGSMPVFDPVTEP